MMKNISTISSKGQVTIPILIREHLQLSEKDEVEFLIDEHSGKVTIRKASDFPQLDNIIHSLVVPFVAIDGGTAKQRAALVQAILEKKYVNKKIGILEHEYEEFGESVLDSQFQSLSHPYDELTYLAVTEKMIDLTNYDAFITNFPEILDIREDIIGTMKERRTHLFLMDDVFSTDALAQFIGPFNYVHIENDQIHVNFIYPEDGIIKDISIM